MEAANQDNNPPETIISGQESLPDLAPPPPPPPTLNLDNIKIITNYDFL